MANHVVAARSALHHEAKPVYRRSVGEKLLQLLAGGGFGQPRTRGGANIPETEECSERASSEAS
jgi:hypothetical protein